MAESRVTCPGCQAQYRLKAEARLGARVKCPKCGAAIPLKPAEHEKHAPHRSSDGDGGIIPKAAPAAAPPSRGWIVPASIAVALVSLLLWGGLAAYLLLRESSLPTPAPVLAQSAAPHGEVQAGAVEQPSEAEISVANANSPRAPAAGSSNDLPAAETSPSASPPGKAASAQAPSAAPAPIESAPAEQVVAAPVAGPPIAAPVAPLAAGAGALRYEWRKGDVRQYNIEVVAEMGDSVQTTTGSATLRVSPWRDPAAVIAPPQAEDADAGPDWSGTAFVVHADGYLATCAHVVEGAQKLVVRLNGGAYEAIVVSVDQEHDVALIRINARSLKPLPFADDRRVELGESVRVLGYPYSDVLGASLKASQGIVSGVIEEGADREFQIDAALNHGNSGGPVLNERGEVIGVASSGLKEDHAEGVGFAAPIARAAALLAAEKLSAAVAERGDPPTGPALIARAAKSIALVEGHRQDQPATSPPIEFTASAHTTVAAKSRGGFGAAVAMNAAVAPAPIHAFGSMTVDAFGKMLDKSLADPSSKGGMGLVELLLEKLDSQGRNSWVEQRDVEIAHATPTASPWDAMFPAGVGPLGPQPFGASLAVPPGFGAPAAGFGPPPGFGPPSGFGPPTGFGPPRGAFGPYGAERQPQFEFTSAHLRNAYRIVERRPDGKFVVERNYTLNAEGEGDRPDARVEGLGRFVFDPQLGCVDSMTFEQTISVSVQNVEASIPIRYSFQLATPQEFVKSQLASARNQARTQLRRAARPRAGADPEKQIDQLLATIGREVSAGDHPLAELIELGNMPIVPSRQAKVCRVLLLLISGDHSFEETSALQALDRWADSSCVTPLIKLLDGGDDHRRGQVAEILGKLGDPRAAQPIAQLIAEDDFGFRYARALEALGPAAEKAVLPLLRHKDDDVRRTACGILENIGTRQSLPALQAILRADDENSLASHAAERAIDEIQSRQAGQAVRDEIGDFDDVVPLADARTAASAIDRAVATLSDRSSDDGDVHEALRALADTLPPNEATRAKVARLLLARIEADSSAYTRNAALRALTPWAGPELEAPLLALLLADEEHLRPEIYAALGAAGGKNASQLLLQELDQRQDDKRLAPEIADALAQVGLPVRDDLIARLASQDLLVRAMAARALAGIPGQEVDAALQRALANEKMNIALEEVVTAIAHRQANK